MKRIAFIALTAIFAMTMNSCKNNLQKKDYPKADVTEIMSKDALIQPEYAKGFTVKYQKDGVRLVDIFGSEMEMKGMGGMKKHHDKGMKKAHGEHSGKMHMMGDKEHMMDDHKSDYHFALVPRGAKVNVPAGYTPIEIPIKSTICMTLLQLSNFTALDAHDYVKGITSTKNLFDKDILKRVKEGDIVKIGQEGNFDTEVVMAANPDIIFISPFKRGGYETIKETGITLVPHLGYKELSPLGQAEWIKFVSMFIGKEKEANKIFAGIEERYNAAKALALKVKNRPVVFSGEIHGGNWFAVGGRNYLAQMFRDAGAEYVLKNDHHTGGVPMDFESLYAQAAQADYWRILNSYPGNFSYDALKASDPRNVDFKAFKEKHVIYCNMKQTPYYELSPVQPDILLKDFIAIFHPELMPKDYKPTYYTLLK